MRSIPIVETPFLPRATFCGNVTLNCPWYGHLQKRRLNVLMWRVQCGDCRRWIGLGLHMWEYQSVKKKRLQTRIPVDCIPVAAIHLYPNAGAPAHYVTEAPASAEQDSQELE